MARERAALSPLRSHGPCSSVTGFPHARNAPPVRYRVGCSAWLARVLVFLSLAGVVATLLWLDAAPKSGPAAAAALVLWALACAIAWRFWAALPCGTLYWDGQVWTLETARYGQVSGAVAVHLDLQRRMGLCLSPAGGKVLWLWLEQCSAPEHWGDVRRAVYSRPRPDSASAGSHAAQRGRGM